MPKQYMQISLLDLYTDSVGGGGGPPRGAGMLAPPKEGGATSQISQD